MQLDLTETGTAVTRAEIQTVETEMGVAFPEDYIAFLLEHNGGMPEEDVEIEFIERDPETDEAFEQGCDIQCFSELQEIPIFYGNLRDEEMIPEHYLSIACDSFGNELLLCAEDGEDYGGVYFGNHEWYDPKTGYLVMSRIADSFTGFLDKLKPMELDG